MVGTDAHRVNGAPAMTDRPRIGDVARHAGVSVGTVSNVFNRPDLVADATLRRVEEAVDSLNYVRNESARQLRSGQSRTIGLIVPDVANPFFTDVAAGVEDVTSAAGVLVIVCNSDSGVEKEQRYLRMLAEHQVLGILHVPAGQNGAPVRGRDRRVPLVLLDHTGPAPGACSVAVDDVSGGRLAVAHLLDHRPPADRLRRMAAGRRPGDRPARRRPRGDGRRRAPRDRSAARCRPPRSPSRGARGGAGAGRHAARAGARRRSSASTTCWRSGCMQQVLRVRAAGARRRRHRRLRRHRLRHGGGGAAHVGAPAPQPPRPPRRRAAPRRDRAIRGTATRTWCSSPS